MQRVGQRAYQQFGGARRVDEAAAQQVNFCGAAARQLQLQHSVMRAAQSARGRVDAVRAVMNGVCMAARKEDEVTFLQIKRAAVGFDPAPAGENQMEQHVVIRLRRMRDRERSLEQAPQIEAALRANQLNELAERVH
ncbi:hypothetical protein LMG8323_04262 [Ralstonia mannitolilytica]|nr:hypothetical protein LMG8323_04262 [Ralstonia mannitolilytica]